MGRDSAERIAELEAVDTPIRDVPDLDVATTTHRVNDEIVDAQPHHHVTGVVDEIAGLGSIDRALCGAPHLGGTLMGDLNTGL